MKKIFSQIILIFVFVSVFSVITFRNTEAAVTASIWTSSSSTEVGKTITVSWSSSGADSCSNNFNGSTLTSGEYQYVAGSAGSKTFTVTCQKVWPTTKACYTGVYEDPDPQHPSGGRLSYQLYNGTPVTETGIFQGDYVEIDYKTGTYVTHAGTAPISCY